MRTTLSLPVFMMGLLLALPVRAQQDQDDPALPDIAPQEVEIRGELEFSFPQLERQPLIGFNPPPRVPEVPETRRPFVATYKQRAAELPGRDTALPLLEGQAAEVHRSTDVLVEAGGGRYLSRYVDASTLFPVGQFERIGLDVTYQGTDGHTPDDARAGAVSSRDDLDGQVRVTSQRGRLRTTVQGDGFFNSYVLYDAEAAAGVRPDFDFPVREGRGASGSGVASWQAERWFVEAGLRYAALVYDTAVLDDVTADNARLSERELAGDIDVSVDAEATTIALEGSVTTTGLDGHGATVGDNVFGSTGATLSFPFLGQGSFLVGARLLAFTSSAFAGAEEDASYLTPVVELDLHPAERLHVYARQTPDIEPHTVADLFDENPYLGIEPSNPVDSLRIVRVQPSIRHVDVEVGARLYRDRARLSVYGGWQEQANQRYVTRVRTLLDRYESGFFQTRYAASRTFSAGVEGTLFLTGRLQATASAVLRQATLTSVDEPVPFVSPFTGRATLSYAFAEQRGLLRLGARFRAPADVDLGGDEQTQAYADVDAYARYRLGGHVSVVARLQNALPGMNEWWIGYPEPPLVSQIGLRVDW